ncbi:MAG: hypothetical protein J0H39_14005 [Alphaproteobacteria bacterium]|nr:hypothetical protein [Alphaproteobacteria bacterium]
MTFPFPIVAPPASTPASVTNVAHDTQNTALTTYTFSSLSLGAADATRRIVVAIAGQRLGSPAEVSSVTVAGISASRVKVQQTGNGNDHTVELWAAAVPTGTSGNVVVTFNTGHLRCSVSVFRLLDAAATAHATSSATNSSAAVSAAIDIPADGVAIAAAYDNGNTTYTWTNLTERTDQGGAGNNTLSTACDDFASAQSARSITATQASNNAPQALVIASWGPA